MHQYQEPVVTYYLQFCYLKGSLSLDSMPSFCYTHSSDYIIIFRCRALVGEIIVRLTLLVSEPSKLLYPKFDLAADCPLPDFPAIHPIYWGQGNTL